MSRRIYWVIGVLCTVGLTMVIYSFLKQYGDRPQYGSVYKMAVPEYIRTLNPRKVIWDTDKSTMLIVYDPLIQVGHEYSFKPAICKSWTMNSEGKLFECVIREGVKFHNGKDLTIDDVVFSLNYILASGGFDLEDFKNIKGINEYWSGRNPSISGIYAIGKDRLVIELNEKSPSFVFALASPRIVVLPKDLLGQREGVFFVKPVGSGPFIVEQHDSNKIVLVSNKDYYRGRPYLDGIEIRAMDGLEALAAFRAGQIYDLRFYDFSPDDVKGVDMAKLIPTIRNSSVILYPNNSMPPFNDRKMRRLLFSLVDKGNTLNSCGISQFALKSLLPRGISGHEKVLQDDSYGFLGGLEIAGSLKKTGYKFQPVNIYYSGKNSGKDSSNDCIGKKTNENFERVDIPWKMVSTTSDNMVKIFFEGKMHGDIEGVYAKNEDAYSILRYFMSDNPENVAKINDKAVDEMLKDAANADNAYDKIETYKKIVRRILDEEYVYPLYEKNDVSIFNKRVRTSNGTLNNPYFIDFSKVWLQ